MREFFDWVEGDAPVWVDIVLMLVGIHVGFSLIAISAYAAFTTDFGWLVLGAWV